MTSPARDTKSHVSHVAQSYTDVRGEQSHELHDKYAHAQPPSDNLPFDPKTSYVEGESRKQRKDRELEQQEKEILRKKDETQTKKMPAKR